MFLGYHCGWHHFAHAGPRPPPEAPAPAKFKSGPAAKALAKAVASGATWLWSWFWGPLFEWKLASTSWPPMLRHQVSEAEACALARAFWEEFSHLVPPKAAPPSSQFLRMATRLSKTRHECRFVHNFADYGLAADIPLSFYDVGLKGKHPALALSDIVKCFDQKNKREVLTQGHGEREFKQFWETWRLVQPKHPIFETHRGREGQCIPVCVHCDEGTTLKKEVS